MDVKNEIARQLDRLSPEMQQQVLQFVTSLGRSTPVGESGAALRQFAFALDPAAAREMTQAVEEECERIDSSQW